MIVYGGGELRQGGAKAAIANPSTDLAASRAPGRVPKWDGKGIPPVVFSRVWKLLNLNGLKMVCFEEWGRY